MDAEKIDLIVLDAAAEGAVSSQAAEPADDDLEFGWEDDALPDEPEDNRLKGEVTGTEIDVFTLESSGAPLGSLKKGGDDKADDDEFAHVWNAVDPAKKPRKRLAPSKKQKEVESAKTASTETTTEKVSNEKGEATSNSKETSVDKAADSESTADDTSGVKVLVQASVLAAILPPTTILSQYAAAPSTDSVASVEAESGAAVPAPTLPAEVATTPAASESAKTVSVPPASAEPASTDEDKLVQAKEARTDDAENKAWDDVNRLREDEQLSVVQKVGIPVVQNNISWKSAVTIITSGSLAEYKSRIVVHDYRKAGFFAGLMYRFCGPPKLTPESLANERDEVFCMALMQLDDTKPEHQRMLQTVYKNFTGDKLDCPRFGNHWQEIGFQGADPATDLRGSGMLGIVQMLALSSQYRDLAMRIFHLSHDELQNFPFAVVSLNATGMALQCMREGKLYDEIKRRKSVMETLNVLYFAILYELLLIWKNEFKTIADFGYVKKHLVDMVHKAPMKMVEKFVANNTVDLKVEALEFTEIP